MKNLVQIETAGLTGKRYWRSLEAISGTPEFQSWAEREFQDGASETPEGGSRRSVLKLMAASLGLAGLTACRRPVEHILPLSKGVEGYIPGKPQHYTTVVSNAGSATGLIVEVHDGRPTKIEGNPKHPFSMGATSSREQALILDLYDPDRLAAVKRNGQKSTWGEFGSWLKSDSSGWSDGAGVRVLSERTSSPTLLALKAEFLKKYPAAQWVEFDSVSFDNVLAGTAMAFGQPVQPQYQFDQAAVVLSLDSDFLANDSLSIQPVKQFAKGRRVEKPDSEMNRLYVVEPSFTTTGAMADNRLRARASEIGAIALALAKELNVGGADLKVLGNSAGQSQKFVAAVAKDLKQNAGKSLVVAGPRQPAAVHALAALINQALNNAGATVRYAPPVVDASSTIENAKKLALDLQAGRVQTLFLLGGNPVYSMPADLKFGEAMKKAANTVALAYDENETAVQANWRLPLAHVFEAWGDARALDGTASVQQPLIAPIYDGKSALEVAAMVLGKTEPAHDLVKSNWAAKNWDSVLFEGVIDGTQVAPVSPKADAAKVMAAAQSGIQPAAGGVEVVFHPGASTWDGRFANNAWMQELPEPVSKLVWDNAALLSAATAKTLGVGNGDILSISKGGYEVKVPAMVLPGHADNSISLSLGYGRSAAGRVGRGVGHRVEGLRTSAEYFIVSGADVKKTGATYELVTTQDHNTMVEPITGHVRHPVREATIEEYRHHPDVIAHLVHEPEPMSMYPSVDYSQGNQWGMAIDLNACIGCSACTAACQAENNIPVVGKEQISKGREMYWIRLDRYYVGPEEDPQAVMQPIACQQCENAPCESVCPVAATVHSPEGLNEMAYNRCVGTRYCLNNCPYKVRRFNFFNYHKHLPEVQEMVYNPDVTVRMRGVMEKCNYCVQRIQEAKLAAKIDGRRPLKDGEVVSACMQVCPADAIVFGNIQDPESRVAKLKQQQRDYALLEELNTKPRTTFLAKLRNPNPELA